jgi:hypothetical protein
MKCLFFHCAGREEMEANGGHRGDRTRSLFDRTRPVSAQRLRVSQGHSKEHVGHVALWHHLSTPLCFQLFLFTHLLMWHTGTSLQSLMIKTWN